MPRGGQAAATDRHAEPRARSPRRLADCLHSWRGAENGGAHQPDWQRPVHRTATASCPLLDLLFAATAMLIQTAFVWVV
jgi:hypothetical protein